MKNKQTTISSQRQFSIFSQQLQNLGMKNLTFIVWILRIRMSNVLLYIFMSLYAFKYAENKVYEGKHFRIFFSLICTFCWYFFSLTFDSFNANVLYALCFNFFGLLILSSTIPPLVISKQLKLALNVLWV